MIRHDDHDAVRTDDGEHHVTIAVVFRNDHSHLATALDSLLGQTRPFDSIIVIDDASDDGSPAILDAYAGNDRIRILTNRERMGMIPNYHRALDMADPETDFFAWASGHDVYHPEWLEKMLAAFKEFPDAALAYPRTIRIDGDGERLPAPTPLFETADLPTELGARATAVFGHGYGHMIYGLFRASFLRQAGGCSPTLLPDRMTLVRVARYGTIRQVPEELWSRRFDAPVDLDRHRRILFGHYHPQFHFPHLLVNSLYLLWKEVVVPPRGAPGGRKLGFALFKGFSVHYALAKAMSLITFGDGANGLTRWNEYRLRLRKGMNRALRRPVRFPDEAVVIELLARADGTQFTLREIFRCTGILPNKAWQAIKTASRCGHLKAQGSPKTRFTAQVRQVEYRLLGNRRKMLARVEEALTALAGRQD